VFQVEIIMSDPAFGDSDDEDMQLDNDLGGNMDDLGEDSDLVNHLYYLFFLLDLLYLLYGNGSLVG
jgi:hypothetical protein